MPEHSRGGREHGRISVRGLTKRFGDVLAVDDLTFDVEAGRVTGFLGPNGAGKTTTLRMVLGLVEPTKGTATVDGQRYRDLGTPQRVVGAALEASSFHPGRTARNHLRVLARTAGVDEATVDELLGLVGLSSAADRRAGGFSLGMRQRLGLAAALVGDPHVLVLDEPANGLDPEGIRWLRGFLRHLAAEGRTVLVSSHVLSEVQQTVDDVVIISKGRLVQQSSLAELQRTEAATVVRAADGAELAAALATSGWKVRPTSERGRVRVLGATPAEVGHLLFVSGVELHELTAEASGLEAVFFELTTDFSAAPEAGDGTPDVPAGAADTRTDPTFEEAAR
ncbi:MAG: ABC transporter ATP-binding protein [Actinomycetes bacterium]